MKKISNVYLISIFMISSIIHTMDKNNNVLVQHKKEKCIQDVPSLYNPIALANVGIALYYACQAGACFVEREIPSMIEHSVWSIAHLNTARVFAQEKNPQSESAAFINVLGLVRTFCTPIPAHTIKISTFACTSTIAFVRALNSYLLLADDIDQD